MEIAAYDDERSKPKNCGLAKNMLQVLFSVRLRSARLWATTMNVRTRRPHLITSFLLGLALSCALAAPAAAQGGTPEQRAACEDDAMRLCGQYVPDVALITTA